MRAGYSDPRRLLWIRRGNPRPNEAKTMSEMPKMVEGAKVRSALGRVKWAWGERRNEMAITGLRWMVGLLWINSALGKLAVANYGATAFKATNTGFAAK